MIEALEGLKAQNVRLDRGTQILTCQVPANWRDYIEMEKAVQQVAWPLQMFHARFIKPAKAQLAFESTLPPQDMARVRDALRAVRGVRQAEVDPRGGAIVFFDRPEAEVDLLEERVEELGYNVEHRLDMFEMEQDRRYSEQSHRIAGVFLFVMGFLLIVEILRPQRPLWIISLFFVLPAVWIFLFGDLDSWPYRKTLVQTLEDREIIQHKIFAIVLFVLGVFEFRSRRGAISPRAASAVFAGITLVGCLLLYLHRHQSFDPEHQRIGDIKNAWHMAYSFVGLAIAGSRLGHAYGKVSPYVYPLGLQVLALLLIFYREG